MNYTGWWWCWQHLVAVIGLFLLSVGLSPARSWPQINLPLARPQPQINLLNKGCSQYNATNLYSFFRNQNATFRDLRSQLSNGNNTHFATAHQARSSDPVYGMAQCRNYMSTADCVACFDASVALIRNCSAANGARVIYDGCFLRYESNDFYDQSTLPGNLGVCGNHNASQPASFHTAAEGLLSDLLKATPRINGFFAASTREVLGGSISVYGIAQCAETLSQNGCQDCLTVAHANIRNCPPDADGRAVDAGCFLRYSETSFFSSDQTVDIGPYLGRGSTNQNAAIIGGAVGGIGLLLIILGMFIWYRLSRKSKGVQRRNILGATELQGPLIYSYKDLKSATKDFSEECKLGEGGFGDVYKGILKDGNIVAVKKLAIDSTRAKEEFESEVRVISNVHHRNLIRLIGFCSKGPELLLVLEYMKHGSLDKYLYGEKRGTLNWKQRFDIIFGTARGLAYLHEQYHVTIIHRDIKSSNILLDDDFLPKIADFGLARLLPEDQTHISTKFAGTLGYTSPEYALNGQLSEGVDTYSFGIVVLEIISGRRCSDVQTDTDTEYLLEHAWNLYENDMHLKLIDETLDSSEYREEGVKKILEIALMCTQSPVSLRPSMSEVVVLLLSDPTVEQRLPSRPTYVEPSDQKVRVDGSTTSASSMSYATDTVSDFTGR